MTTYNPAIRAATMCHTFEQAERAARIGLLTEDTWRWYVFFWTWTAPRFSNAANAEAKQMRCYERLGVEGAYRRFDRVKRLRDRLLRGESPGYEKPRHWVETNTNGFSD